MNWILDSWVGLFLLVFIPVAGPIILLYFCKFLIYLMGDSDMHEDIT